MTIIIGGLTLIMFLLHKVPFEMFVIIFLLCLISDTLGMIRKDINKNGNTF